MEILHVEDNPADARLFREALKEAPVTVTSVSSLRAASERLGQAPLPALVVLDVRMPDGSGLAWLGRAKTLAGAPPVVVFSASEDPFVVRQAYEFGANAYVTKPTGASAFLSAVRAMHAFWRTVSS